MQNLETDKYGYTDCVKVGIALDKAKTDVLEAPCTCQHCKTADGDISQCDSVYCNLHKGWFDKDAFCSYGERREK